MTVDSATPQPPVSGRKLLLDFGPLLAFFVVNLKWGILAATGALIPLSVVALFLSWRLDGRVSPIALFGVIAVVIFGGLTLALRDETFIKVKLTVIYAALGTTLGVGLLIRKSPLKMLLGDSFRLNETGWRLLSLRFTIFFFALAVLNEILRRTLSTDAWATFKVFGVLGATLLFTLLQAPLLQKHALEERE